MKSLEQRLKNRFGTDKAILRIIKLTFDYMRNFHGGTTCAPDVNVKFT